jgi:hypothetical protein
MTWPLVKVNAFEFMLGDKKTGASSSPLGEIPKRELIFVFM